MSAENGGGAIRAGIFGFVLGSAVGFALGMLLAPEEGSKLRRRLAFHLENASNKLGDYVASIGDESELSDARQKGESLVAEVKDRAQKLQDEMDAVLESIPTSRSSARTGSR